MYHQSFQLTRSKTDFLGWVWLILALMAGVFTVSLLLMLLSGEVTSEGWGDALVVIVPGVLTVLFYRLFRKRLRYVAPSSPTSTSGTPYAGFWIRVGAYLFDYALITWLIIALLLFTSWSESLGNFLNYGVFLLYHIIFLSASSATPGKKLYGLIVVDSVNGRNVTLGKAVGRTLSYIISSLLLGLGFLAVGWSKTKQGWHDQIAKTVVLKKPKRLSRPIVFTVLLWAGIFGLSVLGSGDYYSGLPGETVEILNSLDTFLSDKPANFQELLSGRTSEDNYEVSIVSGQGVQKSTEEIATENGGAIVFIKTDIGFGSGFLISSDGLIATNYHVIRDASQVGVRLNDKSQHVVSAIVDYDETKDLAILKIDGEDLPYVALGDSDQVKAGEDVVVIGNPEGLHNTVSRGILSSVAREIDGATYIQIDAPISEGNSGGPIFNSYGQVIGIATLVYNVGQNLNFGVPINEIFGGVLVRSKNRNSSVKVEKSSSDKSKQLAAPKPAAAPAPLAPVPPAPKAPPAWHHVTTIAGNMSGVTSFNSESFGIKGSQWRINYSADGNVSVFPNSTSLASGCYDSFEPSGTGTHNIFCSPGTYYLKIIGVNSNYQFIIEDYY